jgi:hypothetical protein
MGTVLIAVAETLHLDVELRSSFFDHERETVEQETWKGEQAMDDVVVVGEKVLWRRRIESCHDAGMDCWVQDAKAVPWMPQEP